MCPNKLYVCRCNSAEFLMLLTSPLCTDPSCPYLPPLYCLKLLPLAPPTQDVVRLMTMATVALKMMELTSHVSTARLRHFMMQQNCCCSVLYHVPMVPPFLQKLGHQHYMKCCVELHNPGLLFLVRFHAWFCLSPCTSCTLASLSNSLPHSCTGNQLASATYARMLHVMPHATCHVMLHDTCYAIRTAISYASSVPTPQHNERDELMHSLLDNAGCCFCSLKPACAVCCEQYYHVLPSSHQHPSTLLHGCSAEGLNS